MRSRSTPTNQEQPGTVLRQEEVAVCRGTLTGRRRCVLLGSATPSVETMYRARSGGVHPLPPGRPAANGMALPQVRLVDMKEEEIRAGNDSVISRPLLQAMEETMARGEQTILFLNRRGASRMLQCVSCGQVPECPRWPACTSPTTAPITG